MGRIKARPVVQTPCRAACLSEFQLHSFAYIEGASLICQCGLHTIALMSKTAALSVRVEPELKAALERLAEEDKRSLASYVEIALQAHVDAVDRKPSRGSRK
jgi:hypothetical protein